MSHRPRSSSRFAPRVEVLEDRLSPAWLVNASTVFYRDIDGDNVTVELSRPLLTTLDIANDVFDFHAGGVGPPGTGLTNQRLEVLNLVALHRNNLSVTFTVDPVGMGNGQAHVGFLDSTGFDLDVVKVRGDLGRLAAGNGDFTEPGVEELRVRSLGRFDPPVGDPGVDVQGRLGFLRVNDDIQDMMVTARSIGTVIVVDSIISSRVQADVGRLGSATVGGSLLGVSTPAVIFSEKDMGPVTIGENITASTIFCNGNLASVTVGGSLTSAFLPDTGTIVSVGAMGPVNIGGHITGGFASNSGRIDSGGRIESVVVGGNVTGIAQNSGVIESGAGIGRVRIGGSLEGGAGIGSGRVHAERGIGRVSIGGQLLGEAATSGEVTSGGDMGLVRVGFLSAGGIVGGSGQQSGRIVSGGRILEIQVHGSLRGGDGAASGIISAHRWLGPVSVGGSIDGGNGPGSGLIIGLGAIASVDVGGSLRNDPDGFAGGSIRAANSLGPVTIGGDIAGSAANPVIISGRGQAVHGTTTDIAIHSVRVAGNVLYAEILGGYGIEPIPAPLNGDAQIGVVVAGGIWSGSSVAAGINAGADGSFGTDDDFVIPGGSTGIRAKIAKISLRGGVEHTLDGTDHYGLVAEKIDVWWVEGIKQPLHPGAYNDHAVPMFPGDLALHEWGP